MGGGSSGVSPINSEVMSSSFHQPQPPRALSEETSNPVSSRTQTHAAQQRLLKSESMPVHLSKGEDKASPAVLLHKTHTLVYKAVYTI